MGLSMFEAALQIKRAVDELCGGCPEMYEQHISENSGTVTMDFEDPNGDIYRISLELIENSEVEVDT